MANLKLNDNELEMLTIWVEEKFVETNDRLKDERNEWEVESLLHDRNDCIMLKTKIRRAIRIGNKEK